VKPLHRVGAEHRGPVREPRVDVVHGELNQPSPAQHRYQMGACQNSPVHTVLGSCRPIPCAPMINTTFNIGITVGAALGGLILTSTSPVNLIITSIAGVVAVTAISVIPRWLPPDRAQSP
jgi:hypothetical protein